WLKNRRPTGAPRRGQSKRGQRGSRQAATDRPNLEVLEDRLTPSCSPATSFPVGVNPQALVTADFNHDGHLDLATANANGDVDVMLGDGQGGFAPTGPANGAASRDGAVPPPAGA